MRYSQLDLADQERKRRLEEGELPVSTDQKEIDGELPTTNNQGARSMTAAMSGEPDVEGAGDETDTEEDALEEEEDDSDDETE